MDLSSEAIVKMRAALDLRKGLRHVIHETLDGHMFYEEAIIEKDAFWERLEAEVTVADEMEEAYNEKDLIKFQPFLDDYQERVHDWFSENFADLLDL